MKLHTTIGLLMILIACSCHLQTNKGKPQMGNGSKKLPKSKTGLRIEYKPTRGQSYTDQTGTKYNLRHIPASITNDSTIPIQVQIAFSKEYDYPAVYNNKQFKVFPMPKVWALDGVEITDSILNELPKYIEEPIVAHTLAPGEKWLIAFGTLYPKQINYGVFPVALFSHDSRNLSHECKSLIDPNVLDIPHLALEFMLGFTSGSQASPDSCMLISGGKISYPGN